MTHAWRLSHLDRLESEAIYILREAAAQSERPALLFSGGKDSAVLVHLARKAFYPEKLSIPLLHIDTGHNFEEVISFRDKVARSFQDQLIIAYVEESIACGSVRLPSPMASRNGAQAVTLLEAIKQYGFDMLLGGARRDEDKARAKERVFSHRDTFGAWTPKSQRPELWDIYNGRLHAGENFRVFPLSNWTEIDIWSYIVCEQIALPDLYFAHKRAVFKDGPLWRPVTPLTPLPLGKKAETLSVRFRTVGDMTCTCPVESEASDAAAILAETRLCTLSERGATRMDDKVNDAAMERRKKEGYF
ncbi:sulfate adenylyltransferase subunit CysD [Candidatus Phycosocius spiralis]|uniref:Sulfate adenylyltransferase subunit 2 n=1 Tax=Candidatus Phycosocius spiralis TaxID=2815099 RepID=A0ABQ4PUI2_9PROT|nr:sulfate adenylyltransferase subunit CysD [Candidatus Phycosocius spiralis]GIU66655.1 sulfate adenylyltransferase [Candidatus Phycosocius spiralis]